MVSKPWLGSVGKQERYPSVDQVSDVGESHLRVDVVSKSLNDT